jgi:ABC-type transport system involved in multi-copper enzyme maturation permease subunit
VTAVAAIAGYALRESLRRRVFLVVLVLSAGFLGLYTLGAGAAFHESRRFGSSDGGGTSVDPQVLTGATLLGLAMFATLFLGTVLAVFLTLSAVRGDAERGLLQPLVVRPLGRAQLLLGRFLGAAAVCALYVAVLYAASVAITGAVGGWWPDRAVSPGLGLVAGIVIVAAVSLLGSVFLTSTANGIAVFMVFGAGLVAGLLGQIGEGIGSDTLKSIGHTSAWFVPFEALYQSGLHGLTADTGGVTGFAVALGPFGGAQSASGLLWPWALAYLALLGALAVWGFSRRDL